jgi:hypothetical protein
MWNAETSSHEATHREDAMAIWNRPIMVTGIRWGCTVKRADTMAMGAINVAAQEEFDRRNREDDRRRLALDAQASKQDSVELGRILQLAGLI